MVPIHREKEESTEHLLRVFFFFYIISKASSGLESWGSRSKGKEPHYGQAVGARPSELGSWRQEQALEIQQGLVSPVSRWAKAAPGTNAWVRIALMWKWHSGYVTQQKCMSVPWHPWMDAGGIRRKGDKAGKTGKIALSYMSEHLAMKGLCSGYLSVSSETGA